MIRALLPLLLLLGCPPAAVDDGDLDGDGSPDALDCDPRNADAFPGAEDPYGDGRDQDCDGMDGVDVDGDGYPSNVRSHPAYWLLWDCEDADPSIHPGVEDLVGDGIDTNCDGLDGVDADRDGHASIASGGDDCDDAEAEVSPSQPDIVGDGRDRNCDGQDGEDADRDGYSSSTSGGDDCDDGDPGIHPGAFDACDGVAADCLASPSELDQDGDGWFPCSGDCADTDPNRYPGAPEGCDEQDLNCDGVPGATDADGDGVSGCAGDCDDSDPSVYPGAVEVCDGRDGDCSGAPGADELDGDGDGLSGCLGDCDDGDPAVHPGAWDGVDGEDEDCDGDPDIASLGWLAVTDGWAGDRFGAVIVGGDFDGDGLVDLAVAAPGSNASGSLNQGRVYVFPGSMVAAGGRVTPSSAPRILQGEAPLDFAGSALAVGDFDGDGLDDLAVGAFGADAAGQNAGRVYVVGGPALSVGGLAGLVDVGIVLDGAGLDAQAGEALAAGDVDGDGRDDLLVGSSGTTGAGAWTGSAALLWGGSLASGSLASAPVTLQAEVDGAFAGRSVGVGDVDGDGAADVLVGAPGLDGAWIFSGAALPASGTLGLGQARWNLPGGGPSARVGEASAWIGDLDGDGRAEIALRRDGPSAVEQAIWRSATLPSEGAITGAPDYTATGATGAAAGSDTDGDGRAELLLGWPGEAAVFLSSTLGPGGALSAGSAALRVVGPAEGLAAAGDSSGDGRGDLAVGGEGVLGVWLGR